MSKNIGVMFKAQDNLTKEIQKMRASVKGMGKSVEEYKKIQDRAFKEKAILQFDMRKAKQELKEMAKLEKDGTEKSKQNYIAKQKQINEMAEGIKRYNKIVKDAGKAEKDLSTTQSRNNNNPNMNKAPNLGKQLVQAGMLKELGTSMGNYAGAALTSRYGDRIGNSIGGAVSSTLSGAMMGASVAGAPGAVIGGAIGATSGVINAVTGEKKEKDNYFKAEVKDVFEKVSELSNKGLEGGSQLAKQRENDVIAFKNILGGKDKSDKFLTDTEKFASVTPYTQRDLLELGKGMMTYGYKQEEIMPELKKLGDAFSALGVDQEGKKSSVTALGRMKSSEKTDLKNINVLQGHGIDAIGILAEKMETSKQKVYEMISKGVINGADTAKLIADKVGQKYKGAMEEFSKTTEGLESTLEDMQAKGNRAEGEGFNNERKKGLSAEIAYLEKVKVEDRKYIGEYKASLKNKEEELMRSTVEGAKQSQEYKKALADGDGAEVGKLLADAQTKAMVEWNNSPEMQKLHEAELSRVKATQSYIAENGGYVNFGQQMAEQFNKGWASTVKLEMPNVVGTPIGTNTKNNNVQNGNRGVVGKSGDSNVQKGNRGVVGWQRKATGGRISDDYYPFLADKNERVLTASENLQYEKNKGKSGGVTIGSINVNVTNADGDEIANAVVQKINNAYENVG